MIKGVIVASDAFGGHLLSYIKEQCYPSLVFKGRNRNDMIKVSTNSEQNFPDIFAILQKFLCSLKPI